MDMAFGGTAELATWAREDLGTAQLGDKRLVDRAVLVTQRMIANPQASIHGSCESRAEFDGARRLLDSDKVKPDLLCEAMCRATKRRVREQNADTLLLILDTTSLNFSKHRATKDLGPIGGGNGTKGQGFLVKTCFAVSTDGVPTGVVAQKRWRRSDEVGSRSERRERARASKESSYWEELDGQVSKRIPRSLHTITICDREADILSFLARCRAQNEGFIVRAAQDRRLIKKGNTLFRHVRDQPVRDRTIVVVRQHPHHTKRYALLTLQYCQVTFAGITHGPKEDRCGPLTVTAIRVAEVNPPKGVKPIEWVLLTSLPVDSPADAWRYVQYYTYRWLIERYHYALKSGCEIEDCQFRTRARLECVLALYSVVAWRLLWLTYLARTSPDLPASTAFYGLDMLAVWLLTHDDGTLPEGDETLGEAVHMVATSGGYKVQSSKAPPGVISLIRGLRGVHVASTAIGRLMRVIESILRELCVPDTIIQSMRGALMAGA